jgi:hypothetical protein
MLSGCDFSGTVTVTAPATGAINAHKPAAHVNLLSNGVPSCDSWAQLISWSRDFECWDLPAEGMVSKPRQR